MTFSAVYLAVKDQSGAPMRYLDPRSPLAVAAEIGAVLARGGGMVSLTHLMFEVDHDANQAEPNRGFVSASSPRKVSGSSDVWVNAAHVESVQAAGTAAERTAVAAWLA